MTADSAEPVDVRSLRERLTDLAPAFDDWATANERLYRAHLTDGLPVVPPSQTRIATMLAGTDAVIRRPTILPIPPGFATPTMWEAAACAVMAGCVPGALPLIVAALSAVTDPAFNLLGIQTTTGAAAPLFIVNGPVAAALEINAGHNVLGPGHRANATIGRALRLILQDVGLALPGSGDMATQGHPGKYSWLVAENVAASPWEPLHVTRGLGAQTSAVTAVGAVGNVEMVLPVTSPEALITTIARSMTIGGNIGRLSFGAGEALVLLPPECAHYLVRHGWSRSDLQRAVFAEAATPLAWLPEHASARIRAAREEAGLPPSDVVNAVRAPESILIVVTGGVGHKATFVPTWAGGTAAVTREVAPL